jgi:OmpA-OmpF porin, OOP family
MKSIKSTTLMGAVFMIALQSAQTQAEQVQLYDHPPSAEEIGRVLFGRQSSTSGELKMRSINFTPKAETTVELAKRVSTEKVSVGLPIEFAYNSTEILPESKPFLDEIGRMLNMADFSDKRLIIEGHTDAAGSESYNLSLSQRRARAVSDFLVRNYNVSRSRLQATGLGEESPLPDRDPYDEVNRRVQFYSAN